MLATIITVCVYIICISTAAFFIGEIYRFVKRKLVKEPEPEMPPTHFNIIDWSDSKELPPKFP
jgi:hypothetical protein